MIAKSPTCQPAGKVQVRLPLPVRPFPAVVPFAVPALQTGSAIAYCMVNTPFVGSMSTVKVSPICSVIEEP